MADINTTLRGNNEEKENPKSPGVIAKKIIQGLIFIILAVAVCKQEKTSSKQAFNIKETNSLMCRQKKLHRPKITDHIKIKTNRTTKPPIIPKQKNLI